MAAHNETFGVPDKDHKPKITKERVIALLTIIDLIGAGALVSHYMSESAIQNQPVTPLVPEVQYPDTGIYVDLTTNMFFDRSGHLLDKDVKVDGINGKTVIDLGDHVWVNGIDTSVARVIPQN